jgi:choline dehydrogenase-like flavoprotein
LFIDTRELADGALIQSDVCVIGGGAAGLTIAMELARHGIGVAVLESGGLEPDEATLDLYRGESTGLPYTFADGCRSRYLGGSSNCWGGWCAPFDEHDFERRDWVPESGWPISRADLEPFYARAHRTLKLGPSSFDPAFWEQAIGRPDVQRMPISDRRLVDVISQFSPPVRFGLDYGADLKRSPNIAVHLHANVTEIETEPDGTTVRGVTVKTLTGRTVRAVARNFVLATGGIENARLLLASNRVQRAGLGNGNDLVGRYFMDHPRVMSASVRFAEAWRRNKLYDVKYHYLNPVVSAHGTCVAAQFALTRAIQEEEGLLNARIWWCSTFPGEGTESVQALIRCFQRIKKGDESGHRLDRDVLAILGNPIDAVRFGIARLWQPRSYIKDIRFQCIVEAEPDAQSRVMLADQRDALGMPRVRIDWRLGERVKRTFDRSAAILAEQLRKAGVAEVRLDPPLEGRDWPGHIEGTWHHMGTTRMHDSERKGVVDRDGRVHGMKNLHIAGSSVFPTVSANFPTFTLVALAHRLSDRLVGELRRVATVDTRTTPATLA